MPTRRSRQAFDRVRFSAHPVESVRALDDDEAVQALLGAADRGDAYLGGVLGTEVLNRVRRAATALQYLPTAVVVLDRDGRVASANPAALDLLRLAREDAIGRDFARLLRPGASGPWAALRALADAPAIRGAETALGPDGASARLAYTATAIPADDGPAGAVVEIAPAPVEARLDLELVLDGVAAGVVVVEADGRVAYANASAAALLGAATTLDLTGATPAEIQERFDVRDAAGRPVKEDGFLIARALVGEGASEGIVRVRNAATGEAGWLHVAGRLVRRDARVPCFVITLRTLTAPEREAAWRAAVAAWGTREVRDVDRSSPLPP